MKIKYVIGDMFESPSLILLHGCNAQGVMGSGVAKTLRYRCEFAYDAYVAHHARSGLKTGNIVIAEGKDLISGADRVIVNAITQEFYGRDPDTVYVDYDGIRQAIASINYEIEEREESMDDDPWVFTAEECDGEYPTITMPLVGAGLANGTWGTIAEIIEEESTAFQPLVYVQNESELKRALQSVAMIEIVRCGEIQTASEKLAKASLTENLSMEDTLKDGLKDR
jgi:O-acetyl-ADP-ribose deacetylase (regulator of RNase III)